MSRRKQARPIRHLDDEEDQQTALDLQITTAPANGTNSSSASEDEASPQTCCNCQTEISSLAEYLEHKKVCNPKYPICDEEPSDPEDLVVSGDEEEMCSDGEKRQEVVRRQRQDAENNNSVEGEEDGETDTDGVPVGFPFPVSGVPGHVTLEALQNTKVAVAQFAATALATNGDNPAALQELAVLQSTLFTLQHQQMMQLSLIQQLQNHLTVQPKEPSTEGASSPPPPPPPPPPLPPCSNSTTTPGVPLPAVLPAQQVPAKPLRIPTPMKTEHSPPSPPASQSIPPTHKTHPFDHQPLTIPKPPVSLNSSLPPPTQSSAHPPLCSISPSLASSIIKNNDPPPSLNEPNTLEMLQKRAQEVLDNASQGLLANNLADELAFRKNGKNSLSPLSGGRNEPFFKHRCRYCGKVFGSDSALQIHIRSHTVRGNTTCNICFKTFACNSALEIHYRSHTKERPFKCTICDRGFSTKGNMKQHMLTHKIRDMPPHLFENKKSPSFGGPPPLPGTGNDEISDMSNMSNSNSATEDSRPIASSRTELPESPVKPESNSPPPIKRSPPDNDLPVPKRQPSMPKHLCHVCNKNFSSSSALQIHMRTHTGDKPFRCTVCQKAFTTKGNLKVHMGTHMWSNGASRRGRRMSLDLPPIPMNPKDSEFLQRRPDLFYPYLPTPFLNGVQQKLNEMSAIQSGNHHPGNGLHQPGSKFGSILGLGGFGNPDKPLRPDSRSPPSEKQLSSPPLALSMSNHRGSPPSRGSIIGDEMPKGVWDPYFDRKSNHSEEHIDVSSSPGAHISSSSQRGEGLAA